MSVKLTLKNASKHDKQSSIMVVTVVYCMI